MCNTHFLMEGGDINSLVIYGSVKLVFAGYFQEKSND